MLIREGGNLKKGGGFTEEVNQNRFDSECEKASAPNVACLFDNAGDTGKSL